MLIKNIKYIKSAVEEEFYPEEEKIDIAMIGKSNVGKSSLINLITNNRKISRVSKNPGCTKCVNFFLANRSFYIVDLPGYGFAKVPNKMKESWKKMVEEYLLSKRKKIVFLLLDVKRELDEDSKLMINFLEHYNLDYKLIYTKIDKIKRNDLRALKKKDSFYISSLTKEGLPELEEYLKPLID